MFERRGVRLTLVGLVGLYLFLVCAAYLAREPIRPDVSFVVLGPEVVTPGELFPIRAIAYRHGVKAHLKTTISSATITDGSGTRKVELVEPAAGLPALAHVASAPEQEGPFTLVVELESDDGATRTLDVPMIVYHPRVDIQPNPLSLPPEVGPGHALHPEVLTEGPGLVMGATGRLWIRVTNTDGTPATGVTVDWTVQGGAPAEGRVETDEAGVAQISVRADRLAAKVRLAATRTNSSDAGLLETTLYPVGRSVVLSADRLVQAAGEPPLPISITRVDPKEWIYCDLYRGEAWLRSWHLDPKLGQRSDITLDLPSPGTYQVQCYDHFATPGEASDAMWIFRSNEPRVRALSSLLRADTADPRTRAYRKEVPVIGAPSISAVFSGIRTRQVEVHSPALLASTRAADEGEAKIANEKVQGRFFLLIAASFALVFLGAFQYGVQSAIENRNRMALAIEELGEMALTVPPKTGLVRLRTAIQIAFIILVLFLNIAAMLALFQYM